MISRRYFVLGCVGLVTGLWWSQVAFAQAEPASPKHQGAALLSAEEMSRTIPWDTIKWVERRYTIEAMGFKARDETGIDWLGSDEVMIQTNDAKGSTVSNKIGGVDSGDTHSFDPVMSCIVAVRPGIVVLGESSVCLEIGEPAPMFFNVEFWEKDFSLPAGFCIPQSPGPGEHAGPHCANDGAGDDFIGNARIDYSAQELEPALPNVGDELVESVKLDPCPGEICAGFPDYTFTWRITRLPDAQVDFGVLINEVMQKTGARSELEAIAAGLRSLRAP